MSGKKDETDAGLFKPRQKEKLPSKNTVQDSSVGGSFTQVSKTSRTYKADHPKRGVAIIFNHKTFKDTYQARREGTDKDRDDLTKALARLDFDVRCYNDYTFEKIHQVLIETSRENHEREDCFLLCVMSHGEKNVVYAYDESYPTDRLWAYFTGDICPTLAGKPKIFLVQACRGERVDSGIKINQIEVDSVIEPSYKIPIMADILVMYSTYEGFYSWRNPQQGSWMIQSVVKSLQENSEEDLMRILTYASADIAFNHMSNVIGCPQLDQKLQVSVIVSTLTRLFFFKKKN